MTSRSRVEAVTRHDQDGARTDPDLIAIEAPLEVLVAQPGSHTQSLGLLMRTPGEDQDLALGLLYTEGVIDEMADVLDVEIGAAGTAARDQPARVVIRLSDRIPLAERMPKRALSSTSACGLCGRLALRALDRGRVADPETPRVPASVIAGLPATLRAGQVVFADTGGLHGAALCDLTGAPWLLREDIGRHNAVDKVIGAALTSGRLPAVRPDALLAVSGRIAFEIVQKAVAAGVAAVVAVGAPSSLAIDAAREARLTLVGFARDGRFNVYAGAARIDPQG
jgi:FdhD protein